MVARIIAGLLGLWNAGNGLFMLVAPHRWFLGVAAGTGPFNHHFVLDVGVAFLAAGLAFLALAIDRRAALVAIGASGFLVGHAIVHLVELGTGSGGVGVFAVLALPALLGIGVAVRRWRSEEPFLSRQMIEWFGRKFDYDVSYMVAMLETSPRAFNTFGRVTAMANHREVLEPAPLYAAKLVGTVGEDCGPCTQLVADKARRDGVPVDQIAAVLRGDLSAMSEDVALAWRFAGAVFGASPELDELREAIRTRWGDKGVIDLTFALQGSRLYPMVKLGLGFAKECRQVTLDGQPLVVARQAA